MKARALFLLFLIVMIIASCGGRIDSPQGRLFRLY
jgi:hypothetical protein